MKNGIRIEISGLADTGKTIVAQEVVDALRKLGFAVKWDVTPDYDDEQDARKTGITRLEKIEKFADKSTIIVKEIKIKDLNASLNYRVKSFTKKGKE